MNVVRVIIRRRAVGQVSNRAYATTKKKTPDHDEEEQLPSKFLICISYFTIVALASLLAY